MEHMTLEEDVWRFIRDRRDFTRFGEVKEAMPAVSNQQLTNILRRLEKHGQLVRDIGYSKSRPVNTYLAVDLDDPGFTVRVTNDHGWLFAIFEWGDGRATMMDMGELGEYLEPIGDELILKWPAWVRPLADTGRFSFADIDPDHSLHA